MALSRNPAKENRSSTNPSPVPDENLSGALTNEIDDFLGLTTGADASAKPAKSSNEEDPFGLGTGRADRAVSPGGGDLYLGELEDDSDLFTVPDVDELIAKATAEQENGGPIVEKKIGPNAIKRPRANPGVVSAGPALLMMKPPTKKEILATLPKVGEFDPRSENDIIARPVSDDMEDLWNVDSPAAKTDNPFEVDLFATEQAAVAYVENNPNCTNPFAEPKSKNPFAMDAEEEAKNEGKNS